MAIWKRKITVDDKTIGKGTALTLKQSLIPNILVTILFFLWGFAYGLLDVLNSHFQADLNITASKASGLSAAYFGAYFLCPLTISGWILRRFGFRVTFMTGLAVLTVGCLLFWPSGVKRSFGGYCGSMFVVGKILVSVFESSCRYQGSNIHLQALDFPRSKPELIAFCLSVDLRATLKSVSISPKASKASVLSWRLSSHLASSSPTQSTQPKA